MYVAGPSDQKWGGRQSSPRTSDARRSSAETAAENRSPTLAAAATSAGLTISRLMPWLTTGPGHPIGDAADPDVVPEWLAPEPGLGRSTNLKKPSPVIPASINTVTFAAMLAQVRT
jgi:hypothetical protein